MIWVSRFAVLHLVLIFTSCSNQTNVPDEVVLAKVGDRVITVQDFIRRSEYTIRPDYCRKSNYIHKKIILNSLIAEKLTALELDNLKSDELTDKIDQFSQGRKEQAMRKRYYHDFYYAKTELDSTNLNQAFLMSGRTISAKYLNLPEKNITRKIFDLLNDGIDIDTIHNSIWKGNAPFKNINWFDRESPELRKQLFKKELVKGEIIGPMLTEDSSYVIIVVEGWSDERLIKDSDLKSRWDDVRNRLVEDVSKQKYFQKIKSLMRGKHFKLNPKKFYIYANRLSEHYLGDSTIKNIIGSSILDDNEQTIDMLKMINKYDDSISENSILFSYENIEWSVGKFHEAIKTHPLVFRKRKMKSGEFSHQLKYAIADLLRDIEITKECYRLGIDEHWSIKANENMWNDAYLSRIYLNKNKSNTISTKDQYSFNELNPIIDSLQKKYSDKIFINMKKFESIVLTDVDMSVIQRGVPFPIVVPSFPRLTTNHRVDYGKNIP